MVYAMGGAPNGGHTLSFSALSCVEQPAVALAANLFVGRRPSVELRGGKGLSFQPDSATSEQARLLGITPAAVAS